MFYLSRFINYPLVRPEVLQVTLTNRCNLNCRMCFVNYYVTKPEEEMSTEQVLNLVNQAANKGITVAVFSGGEPFLRNDIFDIGEFCSKKKVWSVVTTNGVLLEDKIQQAIDSKISHLHFSIDGLEQTHDYIRNKAGCFKKTTGVIKEIAGHRYKTGKGPFTSLACVVMKKNISELPEMLKMADELKVDVFDLLPLLPDNTDFTEFQNENLRDLCLNQDEDIEILKKSFNEITNLKTKHTKLNPHFNPRLFVKYYAKRLSSCDWKCFAGFKTVFITLSDPGKTGTKIPCIFMCKGHITEVLEKDMFSLWTSKKAQQLRKEIAKCKTLCYSPCFSIPDLNFLLKLKLRKL